MTLNLIQYLDSSSRHRICCVNLCAKYKSLIVPYTWLKVLITSTCTVMDGTHVLLMMWHWPCLNDLGLGSSLITGQHELNWSGMDKYILIFICSLNLVCNGVSSMLAKNLQLFQYKNSPVFCRTCATVL